MIDFIRPAQDNFGMHLLRRCFAKPQINTEACIMELSICTANACLCGTKTIGSCMKLINVSDQLSVESSEAFMMRPWPPSFKLSLLLFINLSIGRFLYSMPLKLGFYVLLYGD